MTYSQAANPDATNSELDAKRIIKNIHLSNSQRGELIEQYVELITDSMDFKTLLTFVYDTLVDDYSKLSDIELKDEIRYSFDEETLDELLDNVTTDPITQGGQS